MRLIILIAIFLMVSGSFAAWEKIGPYGGQINTLAIASSDENTLYCAVSTADVYKSTDGANTWAKVGSIPGPAISMAVHPNDINTIYVGGLQCVYKSTNGGVSWNTDSVANSYVYSITIHPTAHNTIYAAGGQTVAASPYMAFFKSTDAGNSWTYVVLSAFKGAAQCLALDKLNPDIIYVGGSYTNSISYPAVYKSTNGGISFTETSAGLPDSCYVIQALATHPANSNILYAGAGIGLYRSTTGGSSWQYVSSLSRVSSIVTTQASPNTAYGGADTIIYKTTNSGASWFIAGYGYSSSFTKSGRQLAANQNTSAIVYTADNKGCFKTTNGGTNWSPYNHGILMAYVAAIKHAPSLPSTIYMQYAKVGVFKSLDTGSTWIDLNTPSTCGGFCDLEIHNSNSNFVFGLEEKG